MHPNLLQFDQHVFYKAGSAVKERDPILILLGNGYG